MDRLDTMRIFLRVAELASFTQAADSLGLSKAAVSSAVQALEEQQGTRLLHRTTRKVELTQDGQAFYERCRDLLDDVDEAFAMFAREPAALGGRLRVDMPTGVARNLVLPKLPDFLRRHPKIELELGSTERRVDLVREGYDCVLRVGALGDSGLVARPLGRFRMVNCASPAYLAERGTPRSVADLAGHVLVHFTPVLGARRSGWEWFDGTATQLVPMAGALAVNNAEAYEAACVAGLGLIQAPAPAVERLLRAGTLVEVLPDCRAEPMPVAIVYAHRRHLARRVRAFMDWLEEALADALVDRPGAPAGGRSHARP